MDLSEFTADQFHIVPDEAVKPGRAYGDMPEGGLTVTTDDNLWVLRVKSKHQGGHPTNFSLTFRNAALGTRQVYQGPIVHEDYAFMVPLPTVIQAAHYGDLGRTAIVHEAKVGDIVIFAGHVWEIREDRALHDPYLKLVS